VAVETLHVGVGAVCGQTYKHLVAVVAHAGDPGQGLDLGVGHLPGRQRLGQHRAVPQFPGDAETFFGGAAGQAALVDQP